MKNVENRIDFSVKRAKRWLEKTHDYRHLGYVDGEPKFVRDEFRYLEKENSDEGQVRYKFVGSDGIVFVVLSKKELKKIKKCFKEKIGKNASEYCYKDTITASVLNGEVQHRFYRPRSYNTSITFMSDDGEIWGGNFAMSEDLEI